MGLAKFKSLTLRCFKLPALEDRCEEFGQFAIYLGTLKETPGALTLDQGHTFEAGRAMPVCGNTALMVRRKAWHAVLRESGITSVPSSPDTAAFPPFPPTPTPS